MDSRQVGREMVIDGAKCSQLSQTIRRRLKFFFSNYVPDFQPAGLRNLFVREFLPDPLTVMDAILAVAGGACV